MTSPNYQFDDQEEDRIVSSEASSTEEPSFDFALRPKVLDDFIGQQHIKDSLHIALEAAKKREEALEHVLLYGNPGLGKTSLAHIIANHMGVNITVTSGPALERVGDLAAILSNLSKGDILFIDEIHRMNSSIEEVLYSAMEDYALDIIVGKGPAARTLRMPLEPFTLIGATTKLSVLSTPLRDRFGHLYHFHFYQQDDIDTIIRNSAKRLETTIHDSAASMLASRSRHTPRVANRLLKRVRDYAEVKGDGIIEEVHAKEALDMLRVDPIGLDAVDRKILDAIINTFDHGPVGIKTLAAAIAEEMETIEAIHEPYLLQLGMIERTPRGRKVTHKAIEHIQKYS